MATPERPVILIVDGDEPTRSLFSDALTRAEFDVLTAADGASALAIASDRRVSMVLLDNHMHGMTGTQVIQRLRAGASTRTLPVILVTRTANDVLDPIAGLDLGSSDFLVKPVDLVELVARVKARVRVKGDEDRARRIVETTTDAFVSFDEDDRIIEWTPQAELLFGWSAAEAIGRRFGETLLSRHHLAGHHFRVGRFIGAGEQPLLGEWAELIGLHRDGHEFPIEIAEWGIIADGTSIINASIRDISLHRQTERLLGKTAADGSSRTVIPDMIVLSDTAGSILYVSPAVEETLGWEADQLVGTRLLDLVHPEDRDEAEVYAAALAAGSEVTAERRLRGSDRSYVWMELTRRPIHDRATREMVGVHTAARDITARLAAEAERTATAEELAAMVEQLQKLDRMKTNFVAQVSHEVRTPLTNIAGYVELMLGAGVAGLAPDQRKMLEKVERNTQRLTTMVEDLLTVGEIESDAFSIKAVPMDLVPVIELAAETVEARATLQGVDLSINITGDLGPVDADAFQMERVLLHLLSNAVKFTLAGGRISISARRTDNEVLIKVSDTGVGIPLAEQDRIFDRFYRCERSIDDAAQGAGMGLAISKAVVERHGGTIGVESAPDEGTTMTVTLPVAALAEAHAV
jgi:PAS domain S-box-containing protein